MSIRPAVFEILLKERGSDADSALVAALSRAEPATTRAIIETLLIRNRPEGLLGLIESFHLLDESDRQLILGETDRVFGVLREAAQSREEQVRLNVLHVIQRGCIYRAAYLLDAALHDRSPNIRSAAAEALYGLADELLQTKPISTRPDGFGEHAYEGMVAAMQDLDSYAEDRRQVIGALESGLTSFNLHLQPRVVEAAMWFVDELDAKFWMTASAPRSRTAQVAIRVIEESHSPRLVPFAMAALNYTEFRPHIASLLGRTVDPDFLAAWARQSWRFVQPKSARGMCGVKELACLQNGGSALFNIPADGQRHVPRWLTTTSLAEEKKDKYLLDIIRRGSRAAARSALRVLIHHDTLRTTSLLQSIAGDEDPHLARMAWLELSRRRPLEYPVSELQQMLGEGAEASTPGPHHRPMTFDRYWSQFDRMDDQQREELGRQLLAASEAPLATLGRRLAEQDAAARVRAIRLISLLDLVGEYQDQLYKLSYDASPEVRSAAVAALGKLPNATTRRILHNALADQDPRVQANAVEAVDETGDPNAAKDLLPLLASSNNRVRANAVKALLKLGIREAAETLLRMLNHANRAHRISALWLIERMSLFTLAKRVIAMAEGDNDQQVRDRAQMLSAIFRIDEGADRIQKTATKKEAVPSSR